MAHVVKFEKSIPTVVSLAGSVFPGKQLEVRRKTATDTVAVSTKTSRAQKKHTRNLRKKR